MKLKGYNKDVRGTNHWEGKERLTMSDIQTDYSTRIDYDLQGVLGAVMEDQNLVTEIV